MAWLHDNGDENEFSQFEEDEGSEKDEGLLEETEEEVTITERPGGPLAPPSVPKPKPHRPSAAKSKSKPARAKARPKKPKKKAAAKRPKKSSARKSSSRKSSKSRKKR